MSHSYIQSSEKQRLANFALKCLWGTAKGVAIGYGLMTAGTIVHELGHALTAKFLRHSPINVYFGVSPLGETKQPLLNIAGVKVFSPFMNGKHNFNRIWMHSNREGIKKALINLMVH